jgi:hypothetical protein
VHEIAVHRPLAMVSKGKHFQLWSEDLRGGFLKMANVPLTPGLGVGFVLDHQADAAEDAGTQEDLAEGAGECPVSPSSLLHALPSSPDLLGPLAS